MIRLLLLLLALTSLPLLAEDESGPVISIQSPDTATTFAFGRIKNRALIWNDATKTLSAEVTFVDDQQTNLQENDDTLRFRLPGITFDKAHQIFYATSPKGEVIPVARRKKVLLFPTIEVLPNAIVRISHPRGLVSVWLEAIRPADVARMKQEQGESDTNSMGEHAINLQSILQ
jgi:hypothetical protein